MFRSLSERVFVVVAVAVVAAAPPAAVGGCRVAVFYFEHGWYQTKRALKKYMWNRNMLEIEHQVL